MIDSFTGRYDFLSNFYPIEIIDGGIIYPTVEHAYQANKTDDKALRIYISKLSTPALAKKCGKSIPKRFGFDYGKKTIMELLCIGKFKGTWLTKHLLATGEEELVEGNNWGDTYWGVCNGVGENHLGKILMKIREELKNETIR